MTTRMPLDIGWIHFVGIGGIGMSGIAEVMHNLGYQVKGSDSADSSNTARLRELGIPVSVGQSEENLGEARVIVVSSAIKADNPELLAARKRGLPVVRRAEMLAELMRLKWCVAVAGTHGKTTTTSLVACLLEAGRFDPTVINGGILNAYGTNARLGAGDWMVVEADESDGTFVKLPPTIAVVTNIDPEHLDFYKDFDGLRHAFDVFVENVPFYGSAVVCIDHPEVQAMVGRIRDRRCITYGTSPQAEVRGVNIRSEGDDWIFDVQFFDRVTGKTSRMENMKLPMPGIHNVRNCLAAIAVARELKIDRKVQRRALAGFEGVKRRFTRTGEAGGIGVVDDYGHHPVEIAAVLRAARQGCDGKLIAVVQPHRYSRLAQLFADFCTCFNDADIVIVAPVYAAGEQPVPGMDRDALIEGVRAHGHRRVLALEGPEHLCPLILSEAEAGDLVVCLGAGNITQWANALPGEMAQQMRKAGVG
ncbi:MAG: UDP-N-acetylmuramate--L-alanine ligase [Pseudomonadota bacterium]|jgi:UDP-N-acetylmuramate--alanine ligase|nr:UDP-N-acetylmuramate--L-alanine ligase [Alphaproteobacteria bacterium]